MFITRVQHAIKHKFKYGLSDPHDLKQGTFLLSVA